ncbi:MAG: hypothetical protein QOJ26_571 [Thermoplasmata archaeon]|jgi:hypothetical protein|nr:hypothetical protein [Thermoplasmata archaeon]
MNPDANEGQRWRESRDGKRSEPIQAASGGQVQAAMPAKRGRSQQLEQTLSKPSARRRQGPSETPLMLDIDAAMKEIAHVPAATIHRTAAYLWAGRAIAGYRICAAKAALQEGLSYLYLGEHYREAALAHAAMGEAWQPLYAEIDDAMAQDRGRAFNVMRRRSSEATP